jgi:hypothetical protein
MGAIDRFITFAIDSYKSTILKGIDIDETYCIEATKQKLKTNVEVLKICMQIKEKFDGSHLKELCNHVCIALLDTFYEVLDINWKNICSRKQYKLITKKLILKYIR